jgi:hypothetical protein
MVSQQTPPTTSSSQHSTQRGTQRNVRRSSRQETPQRTTPSTPPDHSGLLVASVFLMLIGWGGLAHLVTNNLPRLGGELWLFFILLQIAITSTVLPVVRYLNVRFTALQDDVPPSGVIVRQSVWIGLYLVTCAWLQIPRALSLPLAIFLAVVFIVVEFFLRSRERAAARIG